MRGRAAAHRVEVGSQVKAPATSPQRRSGEKEPHHEEGDPADRTARAEGGKRGEGEVVQHLARRDIDFLFHGAIPAADRDRAVKKQWPGGDELWQTAGSVPTAKSPPV